MGDIKINRINKNDEILAKLMNSVAAKYDCKVSFEDDTGMVINDCDEEAKPSIIREVAGIFRVKE